MLLWSLSRQCAMIHCVKVGVANNVLRLLWAIIGGVFDIEAHNTLHAPVKP